jgi:hypothetical protein
VDARVRRGKTDFGGSRGPAERGRWRLSGNDFREQVRDMGIRQYRLRQSSERLPQVSLTGIAGANLKDTDAASTRLAHPGHN